MSYTIISKEDYEEMLKLVSDNDRATRLLVVCGEPVIPTFEDASELASSDSFLQLESPSLRIEELVPPCDPSLPPAPPVLSRQAGLYISHSESYDEEC